MSDEPIPPIDDMADVQTPWGILPRWKARALALAEIQTVINDAAEPPTEPAEEQGPDPLEMLRKLGRIRELQRMAQRCDALLERYDLLEQRERLKAAAHAALMAAEKEFTAPPSQDDVDGMTMN
jgi:hypothetical protein